MIFLNKLILVSQINQKNACSFISYEYEQYVCDGCHDLSMMVYDLDDFVVLNIKDVDYRSFVCNMSKNNAIKLLNNSALDNKDIL